MPLLNLTFARVSVKKKQNPVVGRNAFTLTGGTLLLNLCSPIPVSAKKLFEKSIKAPKGRNVIAWGNATGIEAEYSSSPEGAKYICRPFRA
jgi:hypothetical protein